MKKRIIILCMALILALQLVSCGGNATAKDEMWIEEDFSVGSNTGSASPESPSFSKDELKPTTSTDNDLDERKIIKNANIDFETKEYDAFVDALYSCITENGGYVQSQDTRGSGVYDTYSSRYSSFTIRVPENNYDSFITTVGELGSVTHINEYQNDVTMNYIDIESHIGALQAEYSALISILEKSSNVDDIITVQSRISEINYQLDSLKSQLRKYDDLISYCTVNLSVREVRRETPKTAEMTFGERISAGLSESFADIADDFQAFAIWFIVSLPYIVIWGVIITAVVLIICAINKKSKRKAEIKRIDKICEKIDEEHKKD